jgi:hypothetical protein
VNQLDEMPPAISRSGGPGSVGPAASTVAEPPSQDTTIRPEADRPLHPDQLIDADAS